MLAEDDVDFVALLRIAVSWQAGAVIAVVVRLTDEAPLRAPRHTRVVIRDPDTEIVSVRLVRPFVLTRHRVWVARMYRRIPVSIRPPRIHPIPPGRGLTPEKCDVVKAGFARAAGILQVHVLGLHQSHRRVFLVIEGERTRVPLLHVRDGIRLAIGPGAAEGDGCARARKFSAIAPCDAVDVRATV